MNKHSHKKSVRKKDPKKYPGKHKSGKIIEQTHFWKDNLFPALIVFVIPLLLYASTVSFDYVLDDKMVISENKFVKEGFSGIKDIFSNDSFDGYLDTRKTLVAGARYRPLSIATFAVEYEFFGLNPGITHFINILLYALTGLIVFRVLTLFLPKKKSTKWYISLSFITALLFMLHPLHTEVVANIKGRDDILSFLLAFGTLFYIHRYITNKKFFKLILAAFLFFLALLAKESSITYLAVVPLTLYFFTKARRKHYMAVMLLLFAGTFIYFRIRVNVLGTVFSSPEEYTSIMNNPFLGTSFSEKYATIMYTLGLYIKLLFFPHPLTHDYYPYQIPIIGWIDWRSLVSLIVYLGIIIYGVMTYKKKRILAWSVFYFLITISIVSNIFFPIGTFMNERFLYMPSIAFCLFLAFILFEKLPFLFHNQKKPKYALSVFLVLVIMIGYSVKTVSRLPAWKDTLSLNRAAVKVSTNSARANNFMSVILYQKGLEEEDTQKRADLFNEATTYVDRALVIYPYYKDALKMKAGIAGKLYQIDRDLDKLLTKFYEILESRHVSFVDTYMEYLNPREDKEKLLSFYHRAGFQLLGLEKKDYALAVRYLNFGLQISPEDPQLLEDLAVVYFMSGDYKKSLETGKKALQANPDSENVQEYIKKAEVASGG